MWFPDRRDEFRFGREEFCFSSEDRASFLLAVQQASEIYRQSTESDKHNERGLPGSPCEPRSGTVFSALRRSIGGNVCGCDRWVQNCGPSILRVVVVKDKLVSL